MEKPEIDLQQTSELTHRLLEKTDEARMNSGDFETRGNCRGNYDPNLPLFQYPLKRLSENTMVKNWTGRNNNPGQSTLV